jgi:hypothetical protein
MKAARAAGKDEIKVLILLVANDAQIEHLENLVRRDNGTFTRDQIRDWGNKLVALGR